LIDPISLGFREDILANDSTCQRCMVKQIFRDAEGRHEVESDQPHIDALYEAFRKSGFRFRELILALGGTLGTPPSVKPPQATLAFVRDKPEKGERVVHHKAWPG